MRVLAINCGSSSLKCALIDTQSGARLREARFEDIGSHGGSQWGEAVASAL